MKKGIGDFLILHNFVARNVTRMLASGYGTAYQGPFAKRTCYDFLVYVRGEVKGTRDSTSNVNLINVNIENLCHALHVNGRAVDTVAV